MKIMKFFKVCIKMDKKTKFCDNGIEKYNFHEHKSLIWIINIDINKMVVSKKVSFGKRNF